MLHLDLDDLVINDTNEAAGDALLRIVAARLRRSVRAEDLAGRLGGDEFACRITDAPNREQLGLLVCKLFVAVARPVRPMSRTTNPTLACVLVAIVVLHVLGALKRLLIVGDGVFQRMSWALSL